MLTIKELEKKTTPILKKYPIRYAGVFGSLSRGEARKDSDVDILINYEMPFSLLDLIRLENELKDILGIDVDVVTEGGVSKYIKENIVKDLQVFYGER